MLTRRKRKTTCAKKKAERAAGRARRAGRPAALLGSSLLGWAGCVHPDNTLSPQESVNLRKKTEYAFSWPIMNDWPLFLAELTYKRTREVAVGAAADRWEGRGGRRRRGSHARPHRGRRGGSGPGEGRGHRWSTWVDADARHSAAWERPWRGAGEHDDGEVVGGVRWAG